MNTFFLSICIASFVFGCVLLLSRSLLGRFARRRNIWPRRESSITWTVNQRVFALTVDAVSGFLNAENSRAECIAQASIQIATEVCNVLFVIFTAVAAELLFTHSVTEQTISVWVFPLSACIWIYGLTCLVVVAAFDGFTETGPWCWISEDRPELRLICLYAWVLVAALAIIWSYLHIAKVIVAIKFSLSKLSVREWSSAESTRHRRDIGRMFVFPLIFIISWWAPTTVRITQMTNPDFGTSFAWQMLMTSSYLECILLCLYQGFITRTWHALFHFCAAPFRRQTYAAAGDVDLTSGSDSSHGTVPSLPQPNIDSKSADSSKSAPVFT